MLAIRKTLVSNIILTNSLKCAFEGSNCIFFTAYCIELRESSRETHLRGNGADDLRAPSGTLHWRRLLINTPLLISEDISLSVSLCFSFSLSVSRSLLKERTKPELRALGVGRRLRINLRMLCCNKLIIFFLV